jgi:hypothetical protein
MKTFAANLGQGDDLAEQFAEKSILCTTGINQ